MDFNFLSRITFLLIFWGAIGKYSVLFHWNKNLKGLVAETKPICKRDWRRDDGRVEKDEEENTTFKG
jgi:hypothetical protein